MMLKVLIYAYATGVFSSRGIARKLEEDVAFRVLAAGNFPTVRCASFVVGIWRTKLFVEVVPGGVGGGELREATASRTRSTRMEAEERRLAGDVAGGGWRGRRGGGRALRVAGGRVAGGGRRADHPSAKAATADDARGRQPGPESEGLQAGSWRAGRRQARATSRTRRAHADEQRGLSAVLQRRWRWTVTTSWSCQRT